MGTLKNLNSTLLSTDQIESANTALTSLEITSVTMLSSFSGEELRNYDSISEQNKLAYKVNDYA